MSSTDERNARVQNAYREVNEAITDIGDDLGLGADGGQPMEVMCECGRTGCSDRIELSKAEYEAIRADGARFVLVAGHEVGTVERVVSRTRDYVVAENVGAAEGIARDADPRHRA
jgi:hypothetical protein